MKTIIRSPRRFTLWGAIAAIAAVLLTGCEAHTSTSPNEAVTAATHAASGRPQMHAPNGTSATRAAPQLRTVPGEYLVKFHRTTSRLRAASVLSALAFREKRAFTSVPGLRHVVISPGVDAATAARELARDPEVEYVEPNFIVRAHATPNDPKFSSLWAMYNTGQTGGTSTVNPDIGALAAWDITTGSSNVVIGVIDTGVDYTHEDLAANIFVNPSECNNNGLDNDSNGYVNDCHGINAITHSGDPKDDNLHGTHVAGTIGAVGNNGVGVTGVNWTVTILPCKFLDSSGNGAEADAITCLDYIASMKDRGANVIATNNSWGGDPYSQALSDAIVAQRTRGILFVTSAGNDSFDNDQLPEYPCSYDLSNVICVASAYDGLSSFSNYGRGTVHLAAPGESILSTVLNNGYDWLDGTSMAAAHVTGVLGLLKAQDPTRDWRALKNLLLAGTVPAVVAPLPTLTGGRLYAPNSLNCSNRVVEARMRPANFETLTLAVGASLPLEAININCASPAGNVTVQVGPSGETVTLLDDGNGVDEVAGDGIYSGIWTAAAAGTYALTFPGRAGDVINVVVDPMLRPGFPQKMSVAYDLNGQLHPPTASLIVGNLDADPALEIIAPGYDAGPLYAWKADGSAVPGWPNYGVGGPAQVSLGQFGGTLNGAGVVAGGIDDEFPEPLHLYDGSATLLPGWPQSSTYLWLPAPIADVDGDGVNEIIGFPARHIDGTPVSGLSPTLGVAASDVWVGSPAVADLDADGRTEVVVASTQSVYASNTTGMLAGFPVPTPNADAGGFISTVIGDVNGDGRPEIIVPSAHWSNGAGYLAINIFSNEGILLRTLWTTEPDSNSVVALADLDGDGIPEIIASTGRTIYAWKGDGSAFPGWPVSLASSPSAPASFQIGPAVVGDIDGDGYPDIVVAGTYYVTPQSPVATGTLYALNRHGQMLAGFPKAQLSSVGSGSPAIADLDGSGHNELIVANSPDAGLRDAVFVYDLHGPGPYGPVEWGQYMGGPEHRGVYITGKNLIGRAFLGLQAHGAGTITSSDGLLNCGAVCLHNYPQGATVRIQAAATAGASFTGWLGPCAGQSNPCTLTLNQYTAVGADFASPISVAVVGAGTVTSSPAGINCTVGTCSGVFNARTVVTLTANPTTGNAFNGWNGACSGSSASCTLYVNGSKSVTAQFVDHRDLTIAYAGTGSAHVVSTPAGIDCGSVCTGSFPPGSTLTLTATPATDTYIADWGVQGQGCYSDSNSCQVTLNAGTTLSITLALKPSLSLTMNGSGSVNIAEQSPNILQLTCTSTCTEFLDPGSSITLTSTGSSTSYFTGWGGDCPANAGTCGLYVDQSKVVVANFSPRMDLTAAIAGSGSGTVTSADGQVQCPGTCIDAVAPGTPVTLYANASASSVFAGWSGACTGTATACALTINSASSATATFNSNGTVSAAPPPAATTSGQGSGGGGALDLLSLASLTAAIGARVRSRRLRLAR